MRAVTKSSILEPQVVVAFDCDRPFEWPSRHLLGDVDRVSITRSSSRDAQRKLAGGSHGLTLALADRCASSEHAALQRVGSGRWAVLDNHSRHGVRVNGTAVERALLHDGDLIQIGRTLLLFRSTVPPVRRECLDLSGATAAGPLGLATFVASLADGFAALERVAATSVPVILRGESGTGKDVVARALHTLSRREGPLVALACAAAEDRPAAWLAADGGTLVLDELGELPPARQEPLERVLAESAVIPHGARWPIEFDVRLVGTTRRPLEALVAGGELRPGLFARLAGVSVTLPRLADRREDVGLLVAAMLRRKGAGPSLEPDAALALHRRDWPLNLRELERTLDGAMLLAGAGCIERRHLLAALPSPPRSAWPLAATG